MCLFWMDCREQGAARAHSGVCGRAFRINNRSLDDDDDAAMGGTCGMR